MYDSCMLSKDLIEYGLRATVFLPLVKSTFEGSGHEHDRSFKIGSHFTLNLDSDQP